MEGKVLVINPGSTSTKIALYDNNKLFAEDTLRHSTEEISQYPSVVAQKDFRKAVIETFMNDHGVQTSDLAAVVGRGGLLKPIPGGTFLVDKDLLHDLETEKYNTHASNLGGILSNEFAKEAGVNAYIVDPVVVDELEDIARFSGLKEINRRSVGHPLNQKAVARKVLAQDGKTYEESRVIVAHLGGGISIGAHNQGKIIDMVNGLDGEGPFTPERSGNLPLLDFAKYILDNQLELPQVKKLIAGNSGMKSYLNETDVRNIQAMIDDGDDYAKQCLDAMCYQIGKGIGEMAVILKGQVDKIILTGGIIYSEYVSQAITDYVSWIADVKRYPGEMEMEALFEGARRVEDGEETAKHYRDY